MKILEKADFVELQDDYLDVAKNQLKETGHYPGWSFILSARESIENAKGVKLARPEDIMAAPEGTKPIDVAEDAKDLFKKDPSAAAEIIALAAPNNLDPEQSLSVILENSPKEEKAKLKATIDFLLSQAEPFGISREKAFFDIYRSVLMLKDIHPKDVTAMALKGICKRVDAYAILKMDESWYYFKPKATERDVDDIRNMKSIAGHPDAAEGLVSILETNHFIRTVFVPFTRVGGVSGNEDSKIEGFGEPKILEVGREEMNANMHGRFIGMLKNIEGLA